MRDDQRKEKQPRTESWSREERLYMKIAGVTVPPIQCSCAGQSWDWEAPPSPSFGRVVGAYSKEGI